MKLMRALRVGMVVCVLAARGLPAGMGVSDVDHVGLTPSFG